MIEEVETATVLLPADAAGVVDRVGRTVLIALVCAGADCACSPLGEISTQLLPGLKEKLPRLLHLRVRHVGGVADQCIVSSQQPNWPIMSPMPRPPA